MITARTSFALLCLLGAGTLLACGPSARPTPAAVPTEALAEDEPERTAEWLFVTSEGQPARGQQAECVKVAEWVEGEAACTSELCIHARELGREWLERCAKMLPARRAGIERIVEQATERAAMAVDACTTEGKDLMAVRDCGAPEACVQTSQRWISRCGPGYATPLVVLMLSRTLERRFESDPVRIDFDRRACPDLLEQVKAAQGCDGDQACGAGADAASAWLDRCMKADQGVPVTVAFELADVFIGAGKSVEPIPVYKEMTRLPAGFSPLQLQDQRGVVAWACGERPRSLEAYLKIRRECKPGEVIVVHLDADNRARAVSVPHASDSTFSSFFPGLLVVGEQEARQAQALQQFEKRVRQAQEQAAERQYDEALASLAAAVRDHDWTIASHRGFQAVLRQADADLAPAFRSLGKTKASTAAKIRDKDARLLFVGRAAHNPLHDLAIDGSVVPNSYAAPSGLDVTSWMPESWKLYERELRPIVTRTAREQLSAQGRASLRTAVERDTAACVEAEQKAQRAREQVFACLFGTEPCLQSRATELGEALVTPREAANAARQRLLLVLSSMALGVDESGKLDAKRFEAGCMDP